MSLSPAAGRYLAVGSSTERQERVHTALGALLAPQRVHVWDVSAVDTDPWNWVRTKQIDEGWETRGALFCLTGLRALRERASAAGRPSPYTQLNLARDAWGGTGSHVLLWLDGLEEFDCFLHEAPDLWSHRDVVAWFLSRSDFVAAEGEGPAIEGRVTAAVGAARRTLEDPTIDAESRLLATAELSAVRLETGELLAAWEVLQTSLPGRPRRRPLSQGEWAITYQTRNVLRALQRPMLALQLAPEQAAMGEAVPSWRFAEQRLQRALALGRYRAEEAIPLLTEATSDSFRTADNLLNLVQQCGLLRRASALSAALRPTSPEEAAWSRSRSARIAEQAGDYARSLTDDYNAAEVFTRLGRSRVARVALANAAEVLDTWGDPEAVDLFAAALLGDEAATLRTRTRQFAAIWRRSAETPPGALADLTDSIARLAQHPVARAVAAQGLHDLLDQLDDNALPDDLVLIPLVASANDLLARAHADRDVDVEGAARWGLVRLALLRGDRNAAHQLAGRSLIDWARHWRGLTAEAAIWGTLALCSPDARAAAAHAERAVVTADRCLSVYAQIAARRLAARVHSEQLPAATRLLQEALALARREGLRPLELNLLLESAELPGNLEAPRQARDALALSEALAFPREQARALLDLTLLKRASGDPGSPHRLERAAELAAELGPPRLRARVLAAIRGAPDLPRPH